MTDEEAIAAELSARVEAYGGINKYCRDFEVDKRNFARYLKGTRMPASDVLMRHIRNLGVPFGEFYDSVNERVGGE